MFVPCLYLCRLSLCFRCVIRLRVVFGNPAFFGRAFGIKTACSKISKRLAKGTPPDSVGRPPPAIWRTSKASGLVTERRGRIRITKEEITTNQSFWTNLMAYEIKNFYRLLRSRSSLSWSNWLFLILVIGILNLISLFYLPGPTVAVAVTVDNQVQVNTDDAWYYENNGWRNKKPDHYLGCDQPSYDRESIAARWISVNVPPGSIINVAYISIHGKDYTGGAFSNAVTIYGLDEDDTATFGNRNNLDNRPVTTASTSWQPGAWGATPAWQDSPDISNVIQEIVDRPGWAANNALGIKIHSTIEGVDEDKFVYAYENNPTKAPKLHIEYTTPNHYVWSGGSNINPYASWATAAWSIQDAIDAASASDTVWVRDGTYNENVTINKNNLTVQSEIGPSSTFITGWVKFDPLSENFTAGTLDGFDITASSLTGLVYVCDPEAVYTIDGITIQNCSIHGNASGPGIELDGNVDNTDITGNEIYSNASAGVSMWDGVGTVTLSTNTIRNNAADGVRISYVTSAAQTVTIQNNNDIYSNGLAGVRNDSATSLTVVGNDIYGNGSEGIRNDAGTGTITQNNIYENTMGGIGIQNSCTLEITKNVIRDNIRGGIHTGTEVVDPGGFSGTAGSAVLTIKQNKVYGNGGSGYGGGIDVRHADGTINNNLVYENHRGGIRFGDWIDEIINNTVADNGDAVADMGGGIIYDNINASDAVNASPAGTPPAALDIRNNICAYNQKAGIRACFDNTGLERDYNLLYANYPWNSIFSRPNSEDCGWPALDDMSCIKQQYGGCGAYFVKGVGILLDAPNDIIADPQFVDRAADDYRLQAGSPAVDAGDTSYGDNDVSIPPGVGTLTIDMGAYGGPDGIDW